MAGDADRIALGYGKAYIAAYSSGSVEATDAIAAKARMKPTLRMMCGQA